MVLQSFFLTTFLSVGKKQLFWFFQRWLMCRQKTKCAVCAAGFLVQMLMFSTIFALCTTFCVWTVGQIRSTSLSVCHLAKTNVFTFNLYFNKRQNFVLALPAQRTGLSVYLQLPYWLYTLLWCRFFVFF